jgi:type IV secretory pathway TrbL component
MRGSRNLLPPILSETRSGFGIKKQQQQGPEPVSCEQPAMLSMSLTLAAPLVLLGHRHPPCAIAIVLDSSGGSSVGEGSGCGGGVKGGNASIAPWPHLVSCDESGRALVSRHMAATAPALDFTVSSYNLIVNVKVWDLRGISTGGLSVAERWLGVGALLQDVDVRG